MNRTGRVLTLLLPGLLLVGTARAQPDDPHAADEQAAQAAAREWLALLEDRDFEDSWEAAAAPFRAQQAGLNAWTRSATRLADSVGVPAARTLTSAQYRDTLRAAASEGPFVVLTYRTRFAAGRFEEQLVVTRAEEAWRVAGYRVRPVVHAPGSPGPLRSEGGSEQR
ncbi:MAG: DUF4019 domain-containing protein [Salinibacter sp.]